MKDCWILKHTWRHARYWSLLSFSTTLCVCFWNSKYISWIARFCFLQNLITNLNFWELGFLILLLMIATAFLVYGVNGFYRLVIIISSKDILFQIAAPFRKSFNFSLSPNINHFLKKSNLWLKTRVVIRLGVKSFSCLRFIWQG